ncbi:MAG: Stf0 family sulfotransferase [Sphingomicrobium sp.]
MLEGIETGYEDKYDFPHRSDPPESAYMFASVPRTGSTYLSHLLWKSGCLGAPLEYLNFLPSGPYHVVSGSPEQQIVLWRSLLHRRTSPNGLFGVKCFPTQMKELHHGNQPLFSEVMATLVPRDRQARIVQLKRRDRRAHAISYARAALSGIWRKEQEGQAGTRVEFSREAVDHARALLDQEEASWERLYNDRNIAPLILWYEDVVDQPGRAVASVAEFLGATVDPAAPIVIPEVEKQSEEDPKLWAQHYAASVLS